MKYYLVQYYGNYADEFDVYFHEVMSEAELEEAKDIIGKTDWRRKEFYFGTNEYIDVSTEELMENLSAAREITGEQFQVLQELGLVRIGFGDGLNWDSIIEYAYDCVNNDE